MKVVISGGGIAGLSVAAVLAQRGHEVNVFERASGGALGAGIVSFPNASLVLRAMGLEEGVRSLAGAPKTMRRLSSEAEFLGDLPLTTIDQVVGAPSYSILRADLHRLLFEFALAQGAHIETGRRVTGVTTAGLLQLDDAREVAADWVLGADGRMASPLRRYVHGEDGPRYAGFVNWIGIAESQVDLFDSDVIFDVWGRGERFGVVPINRRVAYFAGAATAPLSESRNEGLLELLERRFAAWPDPVSQVLAVANPESLRQIYVHDHDPIDVWHRGNVLLVGDAAHAPLPTSGQGACQALEDAFHLARLLDENSTTKPELIFPEFTRRRRDKANGIIAAGRGFARRIFDVDPGSIARRDAESRATDFAAAAVSMGKFWAAGLPSALET